MDYSTPGFPVLHHFPQLTQTHVYWVGDAFQPSHSVVPFSSCLQYFPASGSFLMGWFFTLSGQSIRASASASVLPMNSQDWFPLGWTGWISLLSKGPSRVFSNTTVQKMTLPVICWVAGGCQFSFKRHQVAKGLEFQLQHQSFQKIFRTDFL